MTDEPTTTIATRVSPLDAFEADVLACGPDVEPETMLAVLDRADAYASRLKEIRKTLEELAIAWIKVHGPLRISVDSYYCVKSKKKVKIRDIAKSLDKLFGLAQGDMDAVAACLASDPIKQGAFRSLLEERHDADKFEDHFEVTYVDDLEEGHSKKELAKINSAFMR